MYACAKHVCVLLCAGVLCDKVKVSGIHFPPHSYTFLNGLLEAVSKQTKPCEVDHLAKLSTSQKSTFDLWP